MAEPLTEQVCANIRAAISDGRLNVDARLPSVRDLAVQLGVARGTVQLAYAVLVAEMLLTTAGSAGTRVAAKPTVAPPPANAEIERPLAAMLRGFSLTALPFQTGVPAHDAFPVKLWSNLLGRAVRDDAMTPTTYPDPRGHPELRGQIAAYLALARGIRCFPDQIIVTAGYRAGVGLALQVLQAGGEEAWMEEPGYPITRMGLEMGGARPVPVPVDQDGIDVHSGIALAPKAGLAVVTAGQHAPLGATLSRARREALLEWAQTADAWIIEDDYLGELQLGTRAALPLRAPIPMGGSFTSAASARRLSPELGSDSSWRPCRWLPALGRLPLRWDPVFSRLPSWRSRACSQTAISCAICGI